MPYRAFGLSVKSFLPIPGAQEWLGPDGDLGLEILPGQIAFEGACITAEPYRLSGDKLLFAMPGVARYCCEAGKRMVVEQDSAVKAGDVGDMLIATALPMAMWMRGRLMLHAAGVIAPSHEGAVALTGPAGSGKSTLANELIRRGAALVGEDSLALEWKEGRVECSGLPAVCLLRAAEDTHSKRAVGVPAAQQAASAALRGVVVLSSADGEAGRTPRRLDAMAALQALLEARHRPAVPRLLGREPAQLAEWATIAEGVPVYRWNPVRRSVSEDADVLEAFFAEA